MELRGLKVNFLGDSITQGSCASRQENCYVEILSRSCALSAARNYGIGGTRIARQSVPSENPKYDRDFCSRVEEMDLDADLVLVFGGNGGMTKPIDNLIAITFKGKFEKIKDMAPAEYWEYMEDEYDLDIDEMIEEAEENADDMMDFYEEEYGDNIRVSYKITKKKELSDKKLEGIAEALADAYDLDEDKFTSAYELDVEMTIKGSEDDDEEENEMTVIKYAGKWYAITWYKSGDEYRASFMLGD